MTTITKRQEKILDLLKHEGGKLSVIALSEKLGVSSVTIRKDLRMLAEDHTVERFYGGAVLHSITSRTAELSFEARLREAATAKQGIARYAAQFVKDGYGIALDGSTTVYAMLPYLKPMRNLTIVTNSLMIAESFRDACYSKVLVPGGRIRAESATIVGVTSALPDLNLNYGFFSAWGLSIVAGASDVDPDEVQMRQSMIERCLQLVLLLDGRKWGEVAPYTFAHIKHLDRVITSDDAPSIWIDQLRNMGIAVDVVPISARSKS
ncbi:MAG TPA: DeoR/GlpR family DNA-binding transcription regulator [Aggregatilineaceae bacterium]|nr:DeoR/GlpR family DNA-binding transcription regulator [Aggregatilineaceae bacterium]